MRNNISVKSLNGVKKGLKMSNEIKPITIKKLNNKMPILLNKVILKRDNIPFSNVKVVKSVSYREDVLFEASSGEFLIGDVQILCVKNLMNKTTNACRTVVKCRSQTGEVFDRTSDDITKLIGQNNYDILFTSLCSVINQDLRIKGIVSLLTVPKSSKTVSCQIEPLNEESVLKIYSNLKTTKDMHCQTEEYFNINIKPKHRIKRKLITPYVIKETPEPATKKPKKLVISPTNFTDILKTTPEIKSQNEILPDLGRTVFDDDNNSKCSTFSIRTTTPLMMDPLSILDDVDKVTRDVADLEKQSDYKLHNLDTATNVYPNGKPSPLPLENKPQELGRKALLQRGIEDWKNCLVPDESGHMPIHVAVLNNDLDLLKRQCFVLKMRGLSVDIPADNLTPLKMSLYQENVQMTNILLQHNADPLDSDDNDKNCFHIAAEMATEHLQVLVNHCRYNARKILADNEELWKASYASKSDEELTKILMTYINTLYDSQGYTPLMLAAKVGRYQNVKILIESAPDTINTKMPSSGNTALYIAVGAACMDSVERGNKSIVVDHFEETIGFLVENGADPNLTNFNGITVNDLLTEYNNGGLSMLIANKLTCKNFIDVKISPTTEKDACMLIKDKYGNVAKLENRQQISKARKPKKSVMSPKKPAILQKVKKTNKSPKISVSKETLLLNKNNSKPIIIKCETLTSESEIPPVKVDNNKTIPIVQNFRLNKPLLLKTVNNERKIEIAVPNNSKNSNE